MKKIQSPQEFVRPTSADDAIPNDLFAQTDFDDLSCAPAGRVPKEMGRGGSEYKGSKQGPGVRADRNARSAEHRVATVADRREEALVRIGGKIKDIMNVLKNNGFLEREFTTFQISPDQKRGVEGLVEALFKRGNITLNERGRLLLDQRATFYVISVMFRNQA